MKQINANDELRENAIMLSFVRKSSLLITDVDSYFDSKFELNDDLHVNKETETESIILTHKNLIYHVNRVIEVQRLCISSSMIKNILFMTHNNDHSELEKIYQIIIAFYYIYESIRHVKIFIKHCLKCLILQTRRHSTYNFLQSISASIAFFHTLTLNFILVLSKSVSVKLNTIMSVINKYIKRVTFISKKITWIVKDWVKALLNKLVIANWELFKTLISNRDRKFLSKMWNTLFKHLKVILLYSTAYHS